MSRNDLHTSLKSEVINKISTQCGEAILARQAWSKTEVQYSVHVDPNTYSTFGLQWPDFLNYLGFARQNCTFIQTRKCFSKKVSEGFDLNHFSECLGKGFAELENAQKYLSSCGYIFDQPEGWTHFFGGSGGSGRSYRSNYQGDGHTSGKNPQEMKSSEDEAFKYLFTWIELSAHEKGWTIHYSPKHLPISTDIQSVFCFLGISTFNSCPHNDFDPCWFKHIEFKKGNGPFDGNADYAHRIFDAHAQNFSLGIKSLLTAQSVMEQVGLGFLPIQAPEKRRAKDISSKVQPSSKSTKQKPIDIGNFDIAISFAGTERKFAEELATRVRDLGYSVFYDDFYPEQLWGKNLVEFFHSIYSSRAKYCVIFVSQEYLNRAWTIHERQSAQERMIKEKGEEYILPIKVDNVDLPGVPSTIGYLTIDLGIEKISELLVSKLK